jgi:hypothetical protein
LFEIHKDAPDYCKKVVDHISIPIFVPKNSPTFLVELGQKALECMVFNINAIFNRETGEIHETAVNCMSANGEMYEIADYSMSSIAASNLFEEYLPVLIEENTSKKGKYNNELKN